MKHERLPFPGGLQKHTRRRRGNEMKRIGIAGAGISVIFVAFLAGAIFGADRDPYVALKLYDGKWDVTVNVPERRTDQLENHCTRTGLFFACEQILNGKSSALVVFLPLSKNPKGRQEYRTQALLADASKAGEWGRLVIDGNTWTYSWVGGDEKKPMQFRNINHFTGRNAIHFEVQNSENGTTWQTQMAGDEDRRK